MRFKKIYVIFGKGLDCNSYLIKDKILGLIDPGFGKINELKKLGVRPGQIKIIINTHSHYDHCSGNNLFRNAKIIKKKKGIISFGETRLEIIKTPGHTADSVSLYDEKQKILICGDLCFKKGIGRTDLGGNRKDLKKSLKKISELDFKHLLPGHGVLGSKKSVLNGIALLKKISEPV